jgi:uncharacterized protein YcnI
VYDHLVQQYEQKEKNTMRKNLLAIVLSFTLLSASMTPVSAHVTVKPNSVGVAAYQTFTVGVPVEKDVPTIGLRLVIPEGLTAVTPNVKPGWTITTKKTGEGEDAKITEIEWKGGSIPAGQRDEFIFSAKAPNSPADLQWKAYQTYTNNLIVSWDADPGAEKSHDSAVAEKSGPYSVTKVIDDLKESNSENSEKTDTPVSTNLIATVLVSLGMSAVALFVSLRKSQNPSA